LGLNKACELSDFRDPELRGWIREIFPHEITRFGAPFPDGAEYRKHWEIAMTALALSRAGLLNERAEILGVGAGNEPTLFWLTNHVRRVFATDLYLDPAEWEQSADASMLLHPEIHWPGPWRPRRLVVQHMDARELGYEAESFDAIFSSSSLEHFGDRGDVARAVGEMHRVLRPGGLLSISTELRLQGPGPGLPGVLMFDAADIAELVIDNGPWQPLDSPRLAVSADTLASFQEFADSATDVKRHVAREGRLVFHRLDWSRYPQVVLREGALVWTSVHLALRRA
jgi:SAM-dependent methyltransferase